MGMSVRDCLGYELMMEGSATVGGIIPEEAVLDYIISVVKHEPELVSYKCSFMIFASRSCPSSCLTSLNDTL